MQRPIKVASFNWSPANASGTILTSWHSGNLTNLEPWASKLQGFRSVTGDIKFRITLSASPQQQGALYIRFLPMSDGTPGFDYIYGGHTYNLKTVSQLPGVTMQTCHKEAILTFPLRCPSGVVALETGGSDIVFTWGKLDLWVLDVLRTGSSGSSTAQVSIYVSLENVTLGAPTVPQSGGSKFKSHVIKRKLVPAEVEQSEYGEGPVSGPLLQMSNAMSSLSFIPSLGQLVKPVSWALNLSSKAATAFGYSKPLSTTHEHPVSAQPHISAYNSDLMETSMVMSTKRDNAIVLLDDIAGHDDDELSIDFIKIKYAYYKTILINASSSGYVDKIKLGPQMYDELHTIPGPINPRSWYSCTPMGYISRFFTQWRGSINLRVRIIKTMFHSGTISFTYIPANYAPTSLDDTQQAYSYTEIVDISAVDEVNLRIPYLYPRYYIPSDTSMGVLILKIINPLKAPDNVSSSISLIYEVAGGPDMEFSIPTTRSNFSPIVPQSGIEEDGCLTDTRDYGVEESDSNTKMSQLCVGERIVSLRQLMSTYQPISFETVRGDIPTIFAGTIIDPSHYGASSYTATSATTFTCGIVRDYFTAFASCYLFRRGTFKFRFMTSAEPGSMAVSYDPSNSDGIYQYYNVSDNNLSLVKGTSPKSRLSVFPTVHGGCSVSFPHLSCAPIHVNVPYVCTATTDNIPFLNALNDRPRTVSWKYNGPNASIKGGISRAIGEDFQMAYWLGVPIVTLN